MTSTTWPGSGRCFDGTAFATEWTPSLDVIMWCSSRIPRPLREIGFLMQQCQRSYPMFPLLNRSPNSAPHDRGTSVGIDRESPRLARSSIRRLDAVIAIEVGEI